MAEAEPEGRFHSIAHLLDVPALRRAYEAIREDAAPGVDGITKEADGQDLEENLEDLHARMKQRRYRHQPLMLGAGASPEFGALQTPQ